jgi:hypothetical protein
LESLVPYNLDKVVGKLFVEEMLAVFQESTEAQTLEVFAESQLLAPLNEKAMKIVAEWKSLKTWGKHDCKELAKLIEQKFRNRAG